MMDITVVNLADGTEVTRTATAEEESAILDQVPPDPRLELDKQEIAITKGNTQVMDFLNLTPSDVDAWLTANIDNAADNATLKANLHTFLFRFGCLALHAARGRSLR